MAKLSSSPGQPVPGVLENTLQSLLDGIDQKIAPALQLDLERLKDRASGERRVRTLHISFVVGRHEMALPVHALQEIGDMPTIIPLPYLPHWIKGIVQIRGEILSVVDFQLLFHLHRERRRFLKNSYLLFRQDDFKFCLSVNRITGILNVDERQERLDSCSQGEQVACAEMLDLIRGVLVRDRRRVLILNSTAMGQAEKIRAWRSA